MRPPALDRARSSGWRSSSRWRCWARALGPEVNDNLTLPGSDSQAATDLLSARFPSQANGTNPVVLRAPDGKKITASKYKQPIDDTVKALKADPDVRERHEPALETPARRCSPKDKSIGYIALNLQAEPEPSSRPTTRSGSSRSPIRRATPGSTVGFGGYLGPEGLQAATRTSAR